MKRKILILIKAAMFFLRSKNKSELVNKFFYVLRTFGLKGLKARLARVNASDANSGNTPPPPSAVTSDELGIKEATEQLKHFARHPKITVLVHDGGDFEKTQNSIKKQWYTEYETLALGRNDSINKALASARGEYILPIPAGSVLKENALFEIAVSILEKDTSAIYFDSAVTGPQTDTVISYRYLPSFSPVYLAHSFYLKDCTAVKTTEFKDFCATRESLDLPRLVYGFLLNAASGRALVGHIEKVLIHLGKENAVPGEQSRNLTVLREHYDGASVFKNRHSVSYKFNKIAGKVSIVVPVNSADNARVLTDTILTVTDYRDFEIILCTDKTDLLKSFNFPQTIVHGMDAGASYTEMCNAGAALATGDIYVFLQDSVMPANPDWLNIIVGCFNFCDVGAVSPKIVRRENTIKYAGIAAGTYDLGTLLFNGELNEINRDYSDYAFNTREVSVLSTSCVAINKELFDEFSGFCEDITPDKYSNFDLSFKVLEKGKKCVYCSSAEMIEFTENWWDNFAPSDDRRAFSYITQRYAPALERDPYFTENMKNHLLKGVPLDYKIYAGKGITRGKAPKRRILFVSHDLSLTGAPIALHSAAKAIAGGDVYALMLSLSDGDLAEALIEDGIDVLVDQSVFGTEKRFLSICESFDLVFISTLVCYRAAEYLSSTNIPSIWWVHESKESYELGARTLLPQKIGQNIHVYCGGAYAQKLLQQNRPSYNPRVLLYGMPDKAGDYTARKLTKYKNAERPLIITVGTIENRKGQDILAKAVMDMPRDIALSADFLILGRKIHEDTYKSVLKLKEAYPGNVALVNQVPREEMNEIYAGCDFVVCASRDDPMPVFVAEAQMFSKVCICSENTGSASFIEDGVNGFIYRNNDCAELSEKLQYAISKYGGLSDTEQRSRRIYDEHFTMDVFKDNINGIVEDVLRCK